jgi:hypothetical protein
MDDQFSVGNPRSFLNGSSWQFSPVKFYDDDNVLRFDGIAKDIRRNHQTKSAEIICKDIMFLQRKKAIVYKSADWETAADACKNIMDAEEFTAYDSLTINNSATVLNNANCYVKVNVKKEDNVNLLNIIDKLGQMSASDVYMKGNKVYFQHWTKFAGGTAINLDYGDSRLTPRNAPVISTLETAFFNDYSIGYLGDLDTPATDETNNGIGGPSRLRFGVQSKDISSTNSENNQVIIKDLTSAVYIGETYIRRGHGSLSPTPSVLLTNNFSLPYSYKENIELGSYFNVTFAEEGWIKKTFEVVGINRALDAQNIDIESWEIANG